MTIPSCLAISTMTIGLEVRSEGFYYDNPVVYGDFADISGVQKFYYDNRGSSTMTILSRLVISTMTISSSLKVCPKGYIQTKTEEYFIFSYS
jgi:hypothetical protein